MDPGRRTIGATPVAEVWDDRGIVASRRLRHLAIGDIRDLLRRGPLRFVVADVGEKFRWVAEADRFAFWKAEVQPRLAPPDAPLDLDAFPGGLAYVASEWMPRSGSPIILLESHH